MSSSSATARVVFFCAVLVGAGAADPEQPLDLVERLDVLADDLDLERQVLGPVHAGRGRHVPGVALVLHPLEELVELGREVRLDEHLVAAHVDDVVDVLDVDRALLDAGAAGHARPQHVGVDDRAAGRAPRPGPRSRRPAGARASASTSAGSVARSPSAARMYGAFANAWSRRFMISILGESGFSVFHAGHCDWQRPHSVQVAKSSMPFQVKSSIEPMPSVASSSRSSMSSRVTGLPLRSERLDRAEGDRAPAEEHVERRHEDVQVLGVQHDRRGTPASRRCAAAGRRPRGSRARARSARRTACRRLGDERAVAVRQVRRLAPARRAAEQEHRPDDVEDHEQDQPGAAEVRAAEAGLAAELCGCVLEPDDRERREADQAMTAMKSWAKPSTSQCPTTGMAHSGLREKRMPNASR